MDAMFDMTYNVNPITNKAFSNLVLGSFVSSREETKYPGDGVGFSNLQKKSR